MYNTLTLTKHPHTPPQSLQHSLLTHGRQCLQRNMPVLCFGDGKDMEVLISSQSRPLGTMVSELDNYMYMVTIPTVRECMGMHCEPVLHSICSLLY